MSSSASLAEPADRVADDRLGSAAAVSGPSLRSRVLPFLSTVGFTLAIVLLHLGQGVLLARLLGPEGRGQYAAAVLYSQMFLYVGLLGGLEVVCGRAVRLAERNRADGSTDRTDSLRRAALRLGITTGLLTMAVVWLMAWIAMPQSKSSLVPLAMLCGVSIIGQHVVLMMTGVDRGLENFAAYNWRRFIAAAAFPLMVGCVAIWADLTVAMACWLWVAASVISMAACLIGLPKPIGGRSTPSIGSLLHRGRAYAASMFATDLFERLDLLLVLWLAPIVEQGFYAAMVPAVYPLTVIPNTLGVFLFNAGADRSRRLSRAAIGRILLSSIAVQTVLTVGFMLLIGTVVRWVYGPEFAPAVKYAMWLAPASAIRGILQGIDGYLKGGGRPMACVLARVVGVACLVALTAVLYPIHGVIAIAMAMLISQAVCFVILATVMYADGAKTEVEQTG